ncbi:MAG: beta-glucosidase BglX [Candidatus Hodarchaeota archaeon]
MESIEGLWKFTIALPGHGMLKSVLEIEIDDGDVSTYFCINDQFETDLVDVELKENRLSGSGSMLGSNVKLVLDFEGDRFTGIFLKDGLEIPVSGWNFETEPKKDTLEKKEYDLLQDELKNKELKPIKPLPDAEIHEKIDELLGNMTLDEKIGQLYQIPGSGMLTGPNPDLEDARGLVKKGLVGSLLGSMSAASCYPMQKTAVEETRLGIPLMFMADVIHGLRTIFPIPLATASSWDLDAITKSARVAATESGVAGINLTFGPMVDIARDPRWGRIMEGAGEDPYLGSCCAAAFVRGFQGDDFSRRDTIIACVKHYAAYGGAEAGRDYNTVDMSEFRLRNFYLPPYKGAVDAGVGCLMSSFNIILGFPASGNKHLLKDILRDEWGFKGMIISDYNSVMEMIAHGAVKGGAGAAKAAIDATLDIEMVSQAYLPNLAKLVNSGSVKLAQIEDAVRRILYYKYKVGLFDDPYRYMDVEGTKKMHVCKEHRKIARDVAKRSMVLLKNEKIDAWGKKVLPLNAEKLEKVSKIALIGPLAEEKAILGSWSAIGNISDTITLKAGIEAKLKGVELITTKGCDISRRSKERFEKAIDAAREADLVILALGEAQGMSGEAKSRAYLDIPGVQEDLAKEVKTLGKPTVLVLFNGRPLVLNWFDENMDAILEAWFPGTEGGNAIADILFGDYNPSGKLTASFPVAVGQIPVYYNHYSTGRPVLNPSKKSAFISNFLDISNEPLYPFGFGLSYTTFGYSDLFLDKTIIKKGETLEASIKVTNTGNVAGEEVVQLYIQDVVGSSVRPVKELKGFQKVPLEPGESKELKFTIDEVMLSFYNQDNQKVAEPGDFILYIGPSSIEGMKVAFRLE